MTPKEYYIKAFERWQSFKASEVLSKDGHALLWRKGVNPIDIESMDMLQAFRDHLGVRLWVNIPGHSNRGWRSPEENRLIYQRYRLSNDPKGPKFHMADNRFSFHIAGKAFDVQSPDLGNESLLRAAKGFGWTGIGRYDTFLHLDNRKGAQVEWDSRQIKSVK